MLISCYANLNIIQRIPMMQEKFYINLTRPIKSKCWKNESHCLSTAPVLTHAVIMMARPSKALLWPFGLKGFKKANMYCIYTYLLSLSLFLLSGGQVAPNQGSFLQWCISSGVSDVLSVWWLDTSYETTSLVTIYPKPYWACGNCQALYKAVGMAAQEKTGVWVSTGWKWRNCAASFIAPLV